MKSIDNVSVIPVVNSSNILEIGYDYETHDLFVMFKGGKSYKYSGVPSSVFEDIKQLVSTNGSVGKYFSANIRKKYNWSIL